MNAIPAPGANAAFDLVGHTIADGWLVTSRLPRRGEPGTDHMTGGHFSVGYIATKGGKKAFVKAIDVQGVLEDRSSNLKLVDRLKLMSDNHTFESTLLETCKKAKLDRVIQVLASDEIDIPNSRHGIPVPYIMLEMADGDVRKAIDASQKIDNAWKFRVLHNVAVGLQQLHRAAIAHQDLKPSNVLVFMEGNVLAKIGDLGRSSRKGTAADHDGEEVPGAVAYAPPEQIFGIRPERWEDRREGCDVYHLGTLAAFLFTGRIVSVDLANAIPPDMRPYLWGGLSGCDYETALPILKRALAEFVADCQTALPVWAAEEFSQIILSACDPDWRVRGDAKARQSLANNIGIDAYVSRFDRLAKSAAIKMRP